MNNKTYAIGVNMSSTTTKSVIVNRQGVIVGKGCVLPTGMYFSPESFVESLYYSLLPTIEKLSIENIKGIGVGVLNDNYYTGTIDYATNLPWRGVIELADMLENIFNLPCTLTNGANAAAMGEMNYGAARGMKDFIVLTLGTGAGSGIVTNGQLIYGHDGFAGELGHTIVRRGRKYWSTGADGPLEAYASATGIACTARMLLDNSTEPTLLRDYKADEICFQLLCECAMKGDELAQKVFAYTGEILGEALANFVKFSSPEAIILVGEVTKAGDLLLHPTKEHMKKSLQPIFQNKVKLLFSELKEADAAILGASALVWEQKAEKKDEQSYEQCIRIMNIFGSHFTAF